MEPSTPLIKPHAPGITTSIASPVTPKAALSVSLKVNTTVNMLKLSHPVSGSPVSREIKETPTKKTVVTVGQTRRQRRLSGNAPYPLLRGLTPNDKENFNSSSEDVKKVQNLSVTIKRKKLDFTVTKTISELPPDIVKIDQSVCLSQWEYITLNTENYCSKTSPFVCNVGACRSTFGNRDQMNAHIIASHPSKVKLPDISISIQARYHYQNKKDMATPAKPLPGLDPATVKKMGENFPEIQKEYARFIRFKNKYYCVICQNLYSNQCLVIEHLAGKRHNIVAKNYN